MREEGEQIVYQIIGNRLAAITAEMGESVIRSGRSEVLVEARDFSCILSDWQGHMLATPVGAAPHIFPIREQLKALSRKYGADIFPGDVFIGNDPWEGGSHLNDVAVCIPVFWDKELIGFAASRGHLIDVGGVSGGSVSGLSTEIYHDGMVIPWAKLYEKGAFSSSLWDVILRNTREPELNSGDLHALVAGCRYAEREMQNLVQRYGTNIFKRAVEDIFDRDERLMRAKIAAIPGGTFVYEGYLDRWEPEGQPSVIRAAVTIDGSEVLVDFTGTAPQKQGMGNVSRAIGLCWAWVAVKAALDPGGRVTEGSFRPIRIILPEGIILNARYPASVGPFLSTAPAATVTMGALAKALPENVMGGENSTGSYLLIDLLPDPERGLSRRILYDAPTIGCGATAHQDGLDIVRALHVGNINTASIEAMEDAHPAVLYTRYRLRRGSGGAGRFRGGDGCIREFRLDREGALSVTVTGNCEIPPIGMFGGHPGAKVVYSVKQDGRETSLADPPYWGQVRGFPVKPGALIRHETPGGGGYGDPLTRDPGAVQNDVWDGRLSVQDAEEWYGVSIDPRTLEADTARTSQLREALRNGRKYFHAQLNGNPAYDSGVRVAYVRSGAAHGITHGEIVDLLTTHCPGPLRVRIQERLDIAEGILMIDDSAAGILEIRDDDPVQIRALSPASVARVERNS